ncbi:MAG TPA: biotin-dependent carboxyltransferase family protein [Opitutaceae bacterium]|nr:biotin-dependent carboxyltransferase family protein [Opitutaceae bacterium]
MTVIRAGALTTVQDAGRPGQRAAGVPSGGAADQLALRVANLLVGNSEDAAALECTLTGPELVFSTDTLIAIGGAAFVGLPVWQTVRVRAGERFALGACRGGCRSYVAVAGGIDVAPVLGGRGTYPPAKLGGLAGRALRDGDILPLVRVTRSGSLEHWHIDPRLLPAYTASPVLRVVRGAHAAEFGTGWLEAEFSVTSRFDRMGVRLAGPPQRRNATRELLSSAVGPGTVQVPPDGQPIILLADAQTIGGYPRLAHVIGVDQPLAAQLQTGGTVRFREVTLAEAHRLWLARERDIGILREGLAQKFR